MAKPASSAHLDPHRDTSSYRRPLTIAVLGNMVEWYDANLYGLLAIFLAKAFFSFGNPATALLATYATLFTSFIVRPVAGLLLGRLADLRGHRFVLVLTINLMTLGTVGMGLIPTYAAIGICSPILLVICRILQGVGASAEYTVATGYLLENSPASRAHYLSGWCIAATNLGPLLASVVTLLLTTVYGDHFFESGAWRVPFLLSAPLGFISLYLRKQMIADGFLRSRAPVDEKRARVPLFTALRGHWGMVGKLIALGAGNRAATGILQAYIVTALMHQGFGVSMSILASALVYLVGAPVVILAGYLTDKLGGRTVLIGSFAIYGVLIGPLVSVLGTSGPVMLVGIILFAVLNNLPASALTYAYIMAFPKAVRGAASAVNFNLSAALIGATAPLVATWLVALTGSERMLGWYLAAWCLISCAAAIFAYPRHLLPNNTPSKEPAE
jgi:MHS family proline/betaine transporter-like MFS transporter